MDINSTNDNEKQDNIEENNNEVEKTEESVHTSHHNFAGFWMRFWAYLLDLLIVFSLNGLLLSPLWFSSDSSILGIFTIQGILSAVTAYLYFLLMTRWRTQTLGKMVFGLKVIHKDGRPLRWSDLVFREVIGRFMYRSLVVTNILYIVVGFTDQKQGIHDAVADTRVIHDKK